MVSTRADSELDRPYKLQVVLRFSDHRDLTTVLKEKVERELRDNLRAAFGDLVQVEVTRTHPRLKEIEQKGLQALDGWKEVTEQKTHFVLIDYVDNSFYEVRARQHDGYTGTASPVIRKDRTNSRDFLARTIGFILDQDFGVIGETSSLSDDAPVNLTLKGAGLGVPLSRWVHSGDVFRVVEILGRGAQPVDFALLQAQDSPNEKGVVKCKFYHRYKLDRTHGGRGFRCIKLGTTQAPLRVRLVQQGARTLKPLNGYQVLFQRQGFNPDLRQSEGTATDSDGYTHLGKESKPFDKVAFVLVISPEDRTKVLARVPLPIVDDRPVVLALDIQHDAATPLELRRRNWMRRLGDRLLEDRGIVADLNRDAPQVEKLSARLDRVKTIKAGLVEDIDNLEEERKELVKQAAENATGALDLTEGDKLVEQLKRDRADLEKYVEGLQAAFERESDPARREYQKKVADAKQLLRDNEYGKAIKLYEEAQAGLNDPNLAKTIKELRAAWEPKSKEHQAARDFIYRDWPEFDAETIHDQIMKARQAFETCKKASDSLAPQKLLRVALSHDAQLKKIIDDLHPDVNADQLKPQQDALAASTDLAKLMKDVSKFLESSQKKD